MRLFDHARVATAEPSYVRSRPSYLPAAQTNLPVWPRVDVARALRSGRWLVYSSGEDARGLLASPAASAWRWRELDGTAGARTVVAEDLTEAVAGTRILVCGPEVFVAYLGACARERGAIREEIVLVPTDAGLSADGPDEGRRERRVYCSGCTDVFRAVIGIGDFTRCPSCGAGLVVRFQYSRELGAVIGDHHRPRAEA